MEIQKIQSFTVDHDKLEPGLYISRVDGTVTTYDLRTRKPNAGDYMDNLTMHSVEHLFATYIRSSSIGSKVLYFGPMGCQTGFLPAGGQHPERAGAGGNRGSAPSDHRPHGAGIRRSPKRMRQLPQPQSGGRPAGVQALPPGAGGCGPHYISISMSAATAASSLSCPGRTPLISHNLMQNEYTERKSSARTEG